jgi:CheY-like chemotaxis protein
VILEALRLLRATLPSTIEVRTEIAADAPLVLANESQLHQVMVNLCTNAAHAMREGGGVLSVGLSAVDVDEALARICPGLRVGPHVRLTVGDSGHGMDRATAERIFEPFFTTKAPGEGTGLGLAVVHGIMRSHDGLVAVHSLPGQGTTLELYFPAAAQADPAEASGAPHAPRGQGEHVFVVDDEPVLVEIIRDFLTGLGYRVTAHLRPDEAWEDFRRDPRRFDLVVCDLTMPGMTGVDLAERIRAVRPDLPVVLMTGYGGALDAGVLPQSGIREVIAKPFRVSALGDVVHRHLASPR